MRRIMPLLLILLAIYVLLALAVMLGQRRFIYFPTKISPEAASRLAREEGFDPWHNAQGDIIGWQRRRKGPGTARVLIVHGNGGHALHRGYLAHPLHDAGGVDVFVLEYPGYGARAGTPSMRSFLAAAEEALALLPTHGPVYVVAESLGSGVAAYLAKEHSARISGLLFFAPYHDLAAVGQRQMPIFPVKLLMRDRFRPGEWLNNYRGPVKVVLAEFDTIIPPVFGQKLHDDFRGPKAVEIVRGAGHNDIAAQSAEWWKKVFSFWEESAERGAQGRREL